MHGKINLIGVMLLLFSLSVYAFSTATIHDPAVIGVDSGILTNFTLSISNGNGAVKVTGAAIIDNSTIDSALQAVQYASSIYGVDYHKYNFTYDISGNSSDISGPSGGVAMTVLAMSEFSNTPLLDNFAITGVINSNGTAGQIGGILEKVGAAKAAGMKYMILPYADSGSFESILYYLAQQEYSIPITMVRNVTQAFEYATGKLPFRHMNAIDIATTYNVTSLPDAMNTCSSCNVNAFSDVTNQTFTMTQNLISNITGNYSGLKNVLDSGISNYMEIANKGYFYSAANFAFLEYIDAYIIANKGTVLNQSVGTLANNTQAYCNAITPPQLTNTNYEYVIGGELRHAWANYSINAAKSALSSVEVSDNLDQILQTLAQANAWCSAASFMYNSASQMGGNYSSIGTGSLQLITNEVSNAQNFPGMYASVAEQELANKNYAVALYNAEYAMSLANTSYLFYNNTQLASAVANDIVSNSTSVWGSMFKSQALLYTHYANTALNQSGAHNYYAQAFNTAMLSKKLDSANAVIAGSLLVSNVTAATAQLPAGIAGELNQVYYLMFIILVLLFVVLVVLLIVLVKMNEMHNAIKDRDRKRRK